MNRSLLIASFLVASFAVACTTSTEDASTSDEALTGSLANAKACAVRDGYSAAELAAFKTAAKTELPNVNTGSSSLSKFEVTGIGSVYVVEEGTTMSFYDASGALLAKATTGGTELVWSTRDTAALSCNAAPSSPDAGPAPVDPPAGQTCLATDPIDATQFTYIPHATAAAGRCTQQELDTISSYYTQHASALDFAAWKASVSANCGSCAFADVNDPVWAPLLSQDGQFASVIEGGCIAAVSKNADCGRAYQQYQDCTLTACLTNCTTQEEYNACRQDPTVQTTACANAVTDLVSACGTNELTAYQQACRGTTYTFEGPIKVMCVTGQ